MVHQHVLAANRLEGTVGVMPYPNLSRRIGRIFQVRPPGFVIKMNQTL
jgi:hypothetical protein